MGTAERAAPMEVAWQMATTIPQAWKIRMTWHQKRSTHDVMYDTTFRNYKLSMREKSNLLNRFKLIWVVQSALQK